MYLKKPENFHLLLNERYCSMKKEYIIRVKFFKPINGETDYYFGSLSVIYDFFTEEQIGCTLRTLYFNNIEEGKPKITRTCTISKFPVYRKTQKKNE